MEWSIGQLAKLSGISARTLRHYDDIELLRPARTASSGYRWYGRTELRRLQRVLVLRELKLPLASIAAVLDEQVDELASLRSHRAEVAAQRDRLSDVLGTLDRTIGEITDGEAIADEDFFAGIARRRADLAITLRSRYSEQVERHLTAAAPNTQTWGRADFEAEAHRARALYARMSSVRRAQQQLDSAVVGELIAEHFAAVRRIWPVDAASYRGLADLIVTDPTQRAMVAEFDDELPEWLANAIVTHADSVATT